MYLLFRLDDVSAISDSKAEQRIFDSFRARGMKLCIPVIPFVGAIDGSVCDGRTLLPLPVERAACIKEGVLDGTLEVALHGYSHFSISESYRSEFSGLSFEAQMLRLTEGKRFLENLLDIPVNVFVPPFNTYDANTIEILDTLGFRVLSAGIYGAAVPTAGILFIPATCHLKHVKTAIAAARSAPDPKPLIVALFHHYDFREVDSSQGALTLSDLDSLLQWISKQTDLTVLFMREAAEGLGQDLSVRRFIAIDKWRRLERFLPDLMKEQKPVLYYHDEIVLRSLLWKLVMLYCGLMVFSTLCSFGLATILSLFSPMPLQLLSWGAALAGLLSFVNSVRTSNFARRDLALMAIVIGILLGAFARHYCVF